MKRAVVAPPRLPIRPHRWLVRQEGRLEMCRVCPLPKRNRVHDCDDLLEQIAVAERERYGD